MVEPNTTNHDVAAANDATDRSIRTATTVVVGVEVPNDSHHEPNDDNNDKVSYLTTTMTQNYIATDAILSHPKYLEMKGRSILHSNVRIIAQSTPQLPSSLSHIEATATEELATTNDLPADHDNNNDKNNNNNNHTPIIEVRMGRYCHIQANTVIQLQPPPRPGDEESELSPPNYYDNDYHQSYHGIDDDVIVDNNNNNKSMDDHLTINRTNKMTIGSYTMIGHDCTIVVASAGGSHVVSATTTTTTTTAIGSNCHIGNHVVIGHHVIIKDNCIIASHTIIPPYTTIPPFTYCYSSKNSSYASPNPNSRQSLPMDGTTTTTTAMDHPVTAIATPQQQQQRRRQWRLNMDVGTVPPGMIMILQEQAMTTFHTFVRQQKLRQQ